MGESKGKGFLVGFVRNISAVLGLAVFFALFLPLSALDAKAQGFLQFGPLNGDFGIRIQESRTGPAYLGEYDRHDKYFLNFRQKLTLIHPRFLNLSYSLGLEWDEGRYDAEGETYRATQYALSGNLLPRHAISTDFGISSAEREIDRTATTRQTVDSKTQFVKVAMKESMGMPFSLTTRYQKSSSVVDSSNLLGMTGARVTYLSASDIQHDQQSVVATRKWDRARLSVDWNRNIMDRLEYYGPAGAVTRHEVEYVSDHYGSSYSLTFGEQVGKKDRFVWAGSARGTTQTAFPERDTRDFSNRVDLQVYDIHSNALEVFADWKKEDSRQRYPDTLPTLASYFQTSESQTTNTGLKHRLYKSLNTEILFGERIRQYVGWLDAGGGPQRQEWEQITRTSGLGLNYTKKIPDGALIFQLTNKLTEFLNSGTARNQVTEAPHIITLNPLPLGVDNVDPATIVVTSLAGVVYQENLDYIVTTLGRTTSLELVPGSAIDPGQTILVSFIYDVPLVEYLEREEGYRFAVKWRYLRPYWARLEKRQYAREGDPALVDPMRHTAYGLEYKDTFPGHVSTVVVYERSTLDQQFASFQREQLLASLRANFYPGLWFNGGVMKRLTEFTVTGVDQTDQNLNLSTTYRRGRWNGEVGMNFKDQKAFRSRRVTNSKHAKGEVTYGAWVSELFVRNANETYERSKLTGLADYHRAINEFKIGLKRKF